MSLSEHIQLYCNSKNIRHAGKRIVIAEQLLQSTGHIDGDTLWRALRSKGIRISAATVYEGLKWLVQAGFAERKISDDRKNLFSIKESFGLIHPRAS